MRPRLLAAPWCGVPALARALTVLLALAPVGLAAQSLPILSPVSPTTQTLKPGPATLQVRLLFPDGTPAIKQRVDWRVVETSAGAYGGGTRFTDFSGFSTTQIRLRAPDARRCGPAFRTSAPAPRRPSTSRS